MESQLVAHIKNMDSLFCGLGREDLGTLAYQFADKNNLTHTFKNSRAGGWYYNFLKKHQAYVHQKQPVLRELVVSTDHKLRDSLIT
jgi:hypothetical protein